MSVQNPCVRCLASVVLAVALGQPYVLLGRSPARFSPSPRLSLPPSDTFEYLWYEAENMRGLTASSSLHEPLLNPSYLDFPASKTPGWCISGPGVSAEWSQGGESEWNSVAASVDETHATMWQDVEVPRAGEYKVWIRYADFANKTENFVVRILQERRAVFRHEFGAQDLIDPHDETSAYWGWAFTWDGAPATLAKGPARVSIEIDKAAPARRQVDCFLVTNDLAFVPEGRRKPDFAALHYLREWSKSQTAFAPLIGSTRADLPMTWQRPKVAGRDFMMPWNIAKDFWRLYDKPPNQRPLYPFSAEPIDEFVKTYSGKREVRSEERRVGKECRSRWS